MLCKWPLLHTSLNSRAELSNYVARINKNPCGGGGGGGGGGRGKESVLIPF